MEDFIVKEDMICPVLNVHCDDECCTIGSICNVSSLLDKTIGPPDENPPTSPKVPEETKG